MEKLREKQINEYYNWTTYNEILKTRIESNEENVENMWNRIQTTVLAEAKKYLGVRKNNKKKTGFLSEL